MPRKLSRTLRTAATCAIAAGSLAVAPSVAAAECAEVPVAKIFSQFGDLNDYFAVPGGTFEDSLSWTPTGTPTLTTEQSLFGLGGGGNTSVLLEGSETITSPEFCASDLHPYMRYVAKPKTSSSRLVVEAIGTFEGERFRVELDETDSTRTLDWKVSRLVPFGVLLPQYGKVEDVKIKLRLDEGRGAMLVDDVYVDPYKR